MQFFNVIFLFVAFSLISIEARKGQEYNEMLDPHKGTKGTKPGASRLKNEKRNYGSSLVSGGDGDDYKSLIGGNDDSLLNIQAEVETLTSTTNNYVNQVNDCNKDGPNCIPKKMNAIPLKH